MSSGIEEPLLGGCLYTRRNVYSAGTLTACHCEGRGYFCSACGRTVSSACARGKSGPTFNRLERTTLGRVSGTLPVTHCSLLKLSDIT